MLFNYLRRLNSITKLLFWAFIIGLNIVTIHMWLNPIKEEVIISNVDLQNQIIVIQNRKKEAFNFTGWSVYVKNTGKRYTFSDSANSNVGGKIGYNNFWSIILMPKPKLDYLKYQMPYEELRKLEKRLAGKKTLNRKMPWGEDDLLSANGIRIVQLFDNKGNLIQEYEY